MGTIGQAPFRAAAFAALYFERVTFTAFSGRQAGAVAEAARILKPSGLLVIETGIRAPEQEIAGTLQAAGFESVVKYRGALLRIEARRGGL